MAYQKRTKEEISNEIKEYSKKLEKGIKEVFTSDRYRDYLDMQAKFHGYSYRNVMMIMSQCPKATMVASYKKWEEMERHINKGEKAIKILAPVVKKKTLAKDDADKINRVHSADNKDGSINQIEPGTEYTVTTYFRLVPVFDVSQTNGKDLPEIAVELKGSVADYDKIIDAVKAISPAPIAFEHINGLQKGSFFPDENRIVVRDDMENLQSIKTMIHEVAHSILHNRQALKETGKHITREAKEIQAESIAYLVCKHLGLSTDDYSFDYITNWGNEAPIEALKESMAVISKTSLQLCDDLDKQLEIRDVERKQEVKEWMPKPEKENKKEKNKGEFGR